MSTLRQIYREISIGPPFSIADLASGYSLGFQKSDRFEGMQRTKITPTKVTKIDTVEDALRRLIEEQSSERESRTKKQSELMDIGEDLGARLTSSSVEWPPKDGLGSELSVSTTLQSRNVELEFKELSERYNRGDCEQIDIEGTVSIDVDDITVTLNVRAIVWRKFMKIEMAVCLYGFVDSAYDFWYELSGYSACDSLNTVLLTDHRIVFTTCDMLWPTPQARVPLKAGTNAVATLAFRQNLARLAETGTTDKKLALFGHIPEKHDGKLRFATAPHATFRLGTLKLERAYVRVFTHDTVSTDDDDSDSFRETRVHLIGVATVGKRRRAFFAVVPRDDSLLQLKMHIGDRNPPLLKLADADALMGGSLWRTTLTNRLPEPKPGLIGFYNHNTLLPTGKVTSIAVGFASPKWSLKVRDQVFLTFPALLFRWVVGLPDAPSTINVFLEGEGKLTVTDGSAAIVPVQFEATVTFQPRFAVRAYAAAASQEAILLLRKALDLRGQPRGLLSAMTSPFACSFDIDSTSTTLTCIGANGARVTWASQ